MISKTVKRKRRYNRDLNKAFAQIRLYQVVKHHDLWFLTYPVGNPIDWADTCMRRKYDIFGKAHAMQAYRKVYGLVRSNFKIFG